MKRANANPVGMSAIQRKRNLVKRCLATYFKKSGISEICTLRPSDEQHPYSRLCQMGEMEVGLYLSDRRVVWLYLRANSENRELDEKVIHACSGKNISVSITENNRHSRNVAKIEHEMDWQQLAKQDYDVLMNDCKTLIDVMHCVYGRQP